MSQQEPQPRRSAAKRRRRSPTRPNVYVTIIGAGLPASSQAAPPAPVPAQAEARQEVDEPLVSPEWLERRSNRLDAFEQELRRRALDLDVREAELEEKEARFEADVFLREDALESRERAVAEAEDRLGRKETDLGSYVARVQGGFLRADIG
jgi:Skp family chaperone for outer membrane proteins